MKRKLMSVLALLLVASVVFSMAGCSKKTAKEDPAYVLKQRPETVTYGSVGIDNLTAISSIYQLNDNIYTYGDGSYCRENTNDDGFTSGNFQYVDDQGRYVICDAKGSGMITRIWMLGTAVNARESHLQVYIDGEEVPTIEAGAEVPFQFKN